MFCQSISPSSDLPPAQRLPQENEDWMWYNSELRREPITPRYIRRRRGRAARQQRTDHATMNGGGGGRQWGATLCAARKRRTREGGRECSAFGCCGRKSGFTHGQGSSLPSSSLWPQTRQTVDRHPFPEALLHLSMSFSDLVKEGFPLRLDRK